MVSTMRKFKREFPASGMQRIEDPLIMQAKKRSGHRFEYDHAGSMRKIHICSAAQKSLGDFTLAEDVWEKSGTLVVSLLRT